MRSFGSDLIPAYTTNLVLKAHDCYYYYYLFIFSFLQVDRGGVMHIIRMHINTDTYCFELKVLCMFYIRKTHLHLKKRIT